jgi:NTP pyrophosphatase (non-canonical NTP hydrolase)
MGNLYPPHPSSLTLNDYQKTVTLRMKHVPEIKDASTFFGLGVAGEAGEVADLIKKWVYHDHDLDREELLLELGDVLFYVAALASTHGYTLEQVAYANENKLKERYPEGFSTERSRNRTK